MRPDSFSRKRTRFTALALSFGVVAGGVAVVAIPTFASQIQAPADSIGEFGPDATSIPVTAGGFTPGNVVYLKVESPNGSVNYSWNSKTFLVDDAGTVSAVIESSTPWDLGEYRVTVFESEEKSQSFTFTIVGPDGASAEPSATPVLTESSAPEQTPTESPAPVETIPPEPSASPEPAPSESAPPASEAPESPAAQPAIEVEADGLSQSQIAEQGVKYRVSGFQPGTELDLALVLPDGSTAEFAAGEPIVVDENGGYAGHISYAGQWPAGSYTIVVSAIAPAQADGAEPPTASAGFEVLVDEGAQGADDGQAADGGTQQSGQSGTGQGSGQSGAGQGGQADRRGGGLAQTGADPFGPAGLGLLGLAAGGAALAGARFRSRRRAG